MSTSNRRDLVVSGIEDGLISLGFSKKKGLIQKQIAGGVVSRVGLNVKSFPDGTVRVLVLIGVRFDDIYEKGVALGAYPHSDGNLSLSSSLRYLVPSSDGCDYISTPIDEPSQLVTRIITDIRLYGLPAVERLRSMECALSAAVTESGFVWQGVEQFVPLAYFLQARHAEALAAAEAFGMRLGTRGEGKRYMEFILKLRQAMAN
jgi:hypothetical protein